MGFGMIIVQMGTGVSVMLSFIGPIFEEAQTGLSGNMTAVIFGSVKITIFFVVSQIIEKLGRKPLLLVSTTLCSISLFFLGFYFLLKERNFDIYQSFTWLPVASVLFFVVAYSIGLGPVPLTTINELFASNVRTTAFSAIAFLGTLYNMILVTSFPILMKHVGISGCMFFFSASCALGVVFIQLVIPETKGKSMHEIQKMLKGERNTWEKIPQ